MFALSRGRGLKLVKLSRCLTSLFALSRGRGLKLHGLQNYQQPDAFALSRGRGLKLKLGFVDCAIGVRPLTGAWIETADHGAV